MSKKHYTNYSKPETIKEEPEAAVEEAKEESTPVVEESVEEPTPVVGKVVDCSKLRIRKAGNANAEVVCEIPVGTELTIDEAGSTSDFYKVYTAAGVEGFCMKKFVEINQ